MPSEGLESLPDPYTATKGSTLPTFRLLWGSKERLTSFEAEAVPLVGRSYFPCLQSKRDASPAWYKGSFNQKYGNVLGCPQGSAS